MIKKFGTELGDWYNNIIKKAELADYGPTRGDIVIRPYGFAIWQRIVDGLNIKLQSSGHQQAYFPLLIPEKLIIEEQKHIEGLSPKVYTITEGGGNKLTEQLIVRPTSETIANYMFAKWIDSYRDLPIKMYQWSNIARWEERTRPFIKNSEFLWLEGHTVHSNHEEAINEINIICNIFQDFIISILSIPVIFGVEPEKRKFIGSLNTYSAEVITPNCQSLQIAAAYDLGQKFSKIFNVSFRASNNITDFCWATNWGLGFRLIGALVLTHSDEYGLRLPPNIAPIQVMIVPILGNKKNTQNIQSFCNSIYNELASGGVRVSINNVELSSVKETISYWEMKGIPVIILIGNREVETNKVCILRRDLPIEKNKIECDLTIIKENVLNSLLDIQVKLYQQAMTFQKENTVFIKSMCDAEELIENNWVIAKWCASDECENQIIRKFGKVLRCIIPESENIHNQSEKCFVCNAPANQDVLIAKSY